MESIINELKIMINKELLQNEIISFEEFKIMNGKLLEEKNNEYSKNEK